MRVGAESHTHSRGIGHALCEAVAIRRRLDAGIVPSVYQKAALSQPFAAVVALMEDALFRLTPAFA